MTSKSAHNGFWQTSDFLVIITLALGYILEKYVYEPGPIPLIEQWRYIDGGLVISLGVALIILAHITMRRENQPTAPGRPTTQIVHNGIFRVSRNPLYLGVVIAIIGIGIASDYLWFIFLSPLMVVAFNIVLIIPEERYLDDLFGEEYSAYRQKVRRWL